MQLMPGRVRHWRTAGVRHKIDYRVLSALIDIDAPEFAQTQLRWFSHNHFNLLSFYDKDHGARDGSPLRPWLNQLIASTGLDVTGTRVQLLCVPRVLGHAFNPLSLWLCRMDNKLLAIVWQVHNTFGDAHFYVTHNDGDVLPTDFRATADKHMHVSPFLPAEGHYQFALSMDSESINYRIEFIIDDQPVLVATHCARRQNTTDSAIARLVVAKPFTALKVIAGIHWEAIKMFRKRAPLHHRPEPRPEDITLCKLI